MTDVSHFGSVIEESCLTFLANIILNACGIWMSVADVMVAGIKAVWAKWTPAARANCLLVTALSKLLEPAAAKTDRGPFSPHKFGHAEASSLAVRVLVTCLPCEVPLPQVADEEGVSVGLL